MATNRTNYDGIILRGNTWHLRFTVKGVTVAESAHTSSRREAERLRDRRRAELVEKLVLGQLKLIKLHAAIDMFQKSRVGMPSHKNAVHQTNVFKVIPDAYLDKITQIQLQEVLNERVAQGYKPATMKTCVCYFNAMINYVASHGYSACAKLKTIKAPTGKIRWFTVDEEQRFFAAMDSKTAKYHRKCPEFDFHMDENRDICIMLSQTGARWSEAADMSWGQVDLAKRTVFIKRGKGSNSGTVDMSKRLYDMLKRRRDANPDDDHIFPTHVGKQCAVAWFAAAVKRAGISKVDGNPTPHTFRHTFAARLLHHGLGLVEVQQMLGHKQIQSTMVYAHLQPGSASARTAAILDSL